MERPEWTHPDRDRRRPDRHSKSRWEDGYDSLSGEVGTPADQRISEIGIGTVEALYYSPIPFFKEDM